MRTILPLSANAARIVRLLGEDAAIRLFLEAGGATTQFPAAPREGLIVAAVGVDGAKALHAEFGPTNFRVPTAKIWIAQVWHQRGLPIAEIARRLHVADKTVRGWVRGGGGRTGSDQQDRQGDLFAARSFE